MMRGIRGAVTVKKNSKDEILEATKKLLCEMAGSNDVEVCDIVSAIFTVTDDLNREFPAKAARLMGWENVPLLCALEIPVPKSLKKCVRVLMHINSNKSQKEIKHVYLEGAKVLREGSS